MATTLSVLALVVALAALAIAVNGARRRRPADGLDVPEDVPALRSEVAALRADLTASLRHLAVVRYDAFADMGGHLSWTRGPARRRGQRRGADLDPRPPGHPRRTPSRSRPGCRSSSSHPRRSRPSATLGADRLRTRCLRIGTRPAGHHAQRRHAGLDHDRGQGRAALPRLELLLGVPAHATRRVVVLHRGQTSSGEPGGRARSACSRWRRRR